MIKFIIPFFLTLATIASAQPELVADFASGSANAVEDYNLSDIAQLDDKLFLNLNNGTSGRELGILENGSLRIVKDITSGMGGEGPQNFTTYKGKVYFGMYDEVFGSGLWETDGTEVGTKMIFDPEGNVPWKRIESLIVSDGGLLFFTNGNSLYKFDGALTTLIDEEIGFITPGSFPSLSYTQWKGGIMFLHYANDKTNLYYTEGESPELKGTIPGESFNPDLYGMSKTKGGLIFGVEDDPTGLFYFDEATESITEIVDNNVSWEMDRFFEMGEERDLFMDLESGYHLVEGDQTTLLTDVSPDFTVFQEPIAHAFYQDKILFNAFEEFGGGNHIYYSDGTASGTSELFETDRSGIRNMIRKGNMAYFSSGPFDPEFWAVNLETKEFNNFYTYDDSDVSGTAYMLAVIEGYLYYAANLNQQEIGNEIYRIAVDEDTPVQETELTEVKIDLFADGFTIRHDQDISFQVNIYDQIGRRLEQLKVRANSKIQLDYHQQLLFLAFSLDGKTTSRSHYFMGK